ncbi:hypothetical protein QFZ91_001657 [Paraburkholderia sp. JPY419]
MDETYVKVKGQWKYLYRAVEKAGNTVDLRNSLLEVTLRGGLVAMRTQRDDGEPETITVDKSGRQSGCARGAQCGATHTEQDATEQVPEQPHGAGPSCHQAHHQTDEGIQGFPVSAHHPRRYRNHAHVPQRANERRRHQSNSCRTVLFTGDVSNRHRNVGLLVLIPPSRHSHSSSVPGSIEREDTSSNPNVEREAGHWLPSPTSASTNSARCC